MGKKQPIIQISTKTGDQGTTGLADGRRLPKTAPVFQVLGKIDQLSSYLGLVVALMNEKKEVWQKEADFLLSVQKDLFVISGQLAGASQSRLSPQSLSFLEKKGWQWQKELAKENNWQNNFLFPGGSVLAAHLDIARTLCRQTELSIWQYRQENSQLPLLLARYLNRLSDVLYLLRSRVNHAVDFKEKKLKL